MCYGFNVFFVDEEDVVARARIRVHIVRQNPIAAIFYYRFFVVACHVFRAKRAYAIHNDFFNHIFVGAVWSGAGIFEIDERFCHEGIMLLSVPDDRPDMIV